MSRATIILLRKIPVSHGTHSRVCSDPSHYVSLYYSSHPTIHLMKGSLSSIQRTRDTLNIYSCLLSRPSLSKGPTQLYMDPEASTSSKPWEGLGRRTLRRKASRYGEPEPILGIARSLWPTQCGCMSRSEMVELGPERQLHTAVGCSNSNGAFDAIGDLGLQALNVRIKLKCLYKMKISISQASECLTSYLIPP